MSSSHFRHNRQVTLSTETGINVVINAAVTKIDGETEVITSLVGTHLLSNVEIVWYDAVDDSGISYRIREITKLAWSELISSFRDYVLDGNPLNLPEIQGAIFRGMLTQMSRENAESSGLKIIGLNKPITFDMSAR